MYNVFTEGRMALGFKYDNVLVNLYLVSIGVRKIFLMDRGLNHVNFYNWAALNCSKYGLAFFTDEKMNLFFTKSDSDVETIRLWVKDKRMLGRLLEYYSPVDDIKHSSYSARFIVSGISGNNILFGQRSQLPFTTEYINTMTNKFNLALYPLGLSVHPLITIEPPGCSCINCN